MNNSMPLNITELTLLHFTATVAVESKHQQMELYMAVYVLQVNKCVRLGCQCVAC